MDSNMARCVPHLSMTTVKDDLERGPVPHTKNQATATSNLGHLAVDGA